jgi:pimeloyl-ACP methyl ester carboxylesterase
MRRRSILGAGAAAPLTLAAQTPVSAQVPSAGADRLITEEFMVAAADPGIRLYVRNKRPEDIGRAPPERVLLFVHGSTQPAEATFDLPLDGLSWMNFVARHGWDVYLMDVRGYGGSTKPPEMDRPALENPPIARTDIALQDLGAVVDFILRRRAAPRLSLMGWSSGATLMAAYAAAHSERVGALVLYAPVWLRATPPAAQVAAPPLGAYVTAPMATALERLQAGAPEGRRAELMPRHWVEAWWAAALATDPVGARLDPPVLRSPAGLLQDRRDHWDAGSPTFDPGRITAPTLVTTAEWDGVTPDEMVLALFRRLSASPRKRLVEIGAATHFVMLERNRMQLFREVQLFLDEAGALG